MGQGSERVTGPDTHPQQHPEGEESLGGTEDGGRNERDNALNFRGHTANWAQESVGNLPRITQQSSNEAGFEPRRSGSRACAFPPESHCLPSTGIWSSPGKKGPEEGRLEPKLRGCGESRKVETERNGMDQGNGMERSGGVTVCRAQAGCWLDEAEVGSGKGENYHLSEEPGQVDGRQSPSGTETQR